MQVSEESIQVFATLLTQTMSPNAAERKAAEASLKAAEQTPGYAQIMLQIIESASGGPAVRQSASVVFKNFIKYHWQPNEELVETMGAWILTDGDKELIKSKIVGLMVSAPPALQKQLSEALSIISEHDFPAKWPNLLPELVARLATNDLSIIIGILQTAHSIFKRYRHAFRSTPLFQEIKYVLGVFAQPLTDLYLRTTATVVSPPAPLDVKTLQLLLESLRLMSRIFYSLNSQDLPEFFEDHIQEWMSAFHSLLTYQNKELSSQGQDEAGPVDQLQAAICENLNMYMEKYEEEFRPFLQNFVEDSWNLLMRSGFDEKYDMLVTSAIRFLTAVSKSVHHKFFEGPGILQSICEKIVVPNVSFRDQDQENFEDNPIEYIRRDIEGSDSDTRRRVASELIKGLCTQYEAPVTQIMSSYISAMLQEYASNPQKNWKSKDAAIYLVTALVVKTSTVTAGTISTNQLVNIVDFYSQQVFPELQTPQSGSPIIKAASLKFTSIFRNQLPKDVFVATLPLVNGFLPSPHYVVHTYAANCIEKMLTVKDGNTLRLDKAALRPFLQALLTNLFGALALPGSQENDYVMKAIMRLCGVAQEELKPYTTQIVQQLNGILASVCANPKNPSFNHYLFESVACLIRYICADPSAVATFEALLFPPFQTVLQMDVSEFTPYVFQILAQLLEASNPPISATYMALLPPCLNYVLWERQSNVPALVRLLQAYLRKGPGQVGANLQGILGVFQKLASSRTNDHEGFYLLNTIVESVPLSEISPFLPTLFQILFTRLQSSKTIKFIKGLLIFLSLFIIKHGGTLLVERVDALQPKLFFIVMDSVWLPNMGKISGKMERKICAVGVTTLLTETPQLISEAYLPLWGRILTSLITLLESGDEDNLTPEDDDALLEARAIDHGHSHTQSRPGQVDDMPGYDSAFSQLHFAPRPDVDPVSKFPDPRQFLALSLSNMGKLHPGLVPRLIQSSVPSELAAKLSSYFTASNVPIPV